jgi:hypothetical protein
VRQSGAVPSSFTATGLYIGMNGGGTDGYIQSSGSSTTNDYLSLNPNGGNVGIGTTTPNYNMDVYTSGGAIVIRGGTTDGWGGTYFGLFRALGDLPAFPSAVYPVLKTDATDIGFVVAGAYGGYVTSSGFTNFSSRTLKENIHPQNYQTVLEKVEALDVPMWNYKTDHAKGIVHIGPIAEDFHAAFGLGDTNNKTIATIDEMGVTLAALKGLALRVDGLKAAFDGDSNDIAKLKSDNDKLKAANDNDAAQIKALTARLDAIEAARR